MNIINRSLVELDKLMDTCKVLPECKLHIISSKDIKAKHIHIAISGFLSQNKAVDDGWEDMIKFFEHQNLQTFSLRWESESDKSFIISIPLMTGLIAYNKIKNFWKSKEEK